MRFTAIRIAIRLHIEVSKSKITFVAQRKLIAAFVLMALLASTAIAETSLCAVNCALAGLGHPQHEEMHHSPAAVRSETHHHHHMDSSASASRTESSMSSRQCTTYGESVVLAAGTKFVLTRSIELHSNCAIRTEVAASATSALTPLRRDSLPPPLFSLSLVTPIRI